MSQPVRVLVVDDSALMRNLLAELINACDGMCCVGQAADPLQARESIRLLAPDVVTLDVEMPHMDGLEFLRRLMRLRPTPVVMVSSLTARGSEVAIEALALGAVEVVEKPGVGLGQAIPRFAMQLTGAIQKAAQANLSQICNLSKSPAMPLLRPPARDALVLIGASTGGTEALVTLLSALPAQMPPVLIVQHMPAGFTASFARRLDQACVLQVREAQGGEKLAPGQVWVAPGHAHLQLSAQAGDWRTQLVDSDPVNRHRPSVDVLFHSALKVAGRHTVAVLLTGMGRDGAQGLLALRKAGAYTYAQDKASSVVFGMPREAIEIGAACEVASLGDMAHQMVTRMAGGAGGRAEEGKGVAAPH
ncbi:chemotaxis response regulator protein-glutamate methylesterase [Laribacter hongkongensis]|uniref:protein-glutamate methylesterase/protein-glutamine glutaminase n=1 Tax=Laribacter hongkongensis TaxID=168471 RepID=UPI0023D808AA|nr:chemotaxis response regulator protein-glutamate methylesterase [Laribacter hongkongensis]MCG9114653.1 chemotaxis response regulator protein-glutamate methylesterase [Laribacter hongkongensis]